MAEQPSGEGHGVQGRALEWVALLLAFLGVAVTLYQPVMNGEFMSDDLTVIVTNPYVQKLSLEYFLEILHPYAPPVAYAMNYSPVHLLVHAVEVHFFGGETYGFHLVNVLLHVIASVLFVMLLRSSRISWPIAASAGAFFLVHPANVEAVAMIFQAKTTLATGLTFGALLVFWRHPLLSTLFFGLAILTKFTALSALPVACAMYWVRGADKTRPLPQPAWLAAWALVLIAVAIPEFTAFQRAGQGIEMDPLVQARTMVAIAMRYLVTAASSYGVAPLHSVSQVHSWTDPWWLAGLLALALLAWRSGWVLLRREEEAVWWVMAAGAYAPISQVFLFLYPMADRYLYPVLPGLIGGALLAFRGPARRLAAWVRPGLGPRAADFPVARVAGIALMLGFSLFFIPRTHVYTRVFVSGNRMAAESARVYPNGIPALQKRAIASAGAADAEGVAEVVRALHTKGFYDFMKLRSLLGPAASEPRVAAVLAEMALKTLNRHSVVKDRYPIEQYAVAQALIELGRVPEAIEILEDAVAANGPRAAGFRVLLERTRALLEKQESAS